VTYIKPYIAVMDGIIMGGGVRLSVHAYSGSQPSVFTMPKTTIGFFPDVGGSSSYHASMTKREAERTYLGLTSERLTGVQAFYAPITYIPAFSAT
jgi:3-hydroxyisobutyryl-CoA hydrolase